MKTNLYQLTGKEWTSEIPLCVEEENEVELLICFSAKELLGKANIYAQARSKFPSAEIIMCSTAGEIAGNKVQDHSFIAIAFHFDHTPVKTASISIEDYQNSFEAGLDLIKQLPSKELHHLLVFSDGSKVNGSELVKGLNTAADANIKITGGLAGDGPEFRSTLVGLNSQPREGVIIAIGFYGDKISVTHGSQGGWDPFGAERIVTKSIGNVLYEIDHRNALELYKKYLGPDVDQLPGSALLFPLAVILPGSHEAVGRTILSIDEQRSSMTFAGDIPEGSKVRFMKANFDKLTAAASNAATETLAQHSESPVFSLLVSCVGRKLILGRRTEEEVEAVADTLGSNTMLAGFYSYGEIAPLHDGGSCQLHNQTMTITSFYEYA